MDGMPDDVPWDFPGLVMSLSALLLAHSHLKVPYLHQQALLLQASAQLVSLPCVRAPPAVAGSMHPVANVDFVV